MRLKGTCKWFNVVKGYGFVTPEGEGGDSNEKCDLFVHQLNIKSGGFRSLREGEPVEYDLEVGDGKNKAINVTGPSGAPVLGALPRHEHYGMPMQMMARGGRGGHQTGGGRFGQGMNSQRPGHDSMGHGASSSGDYPYGYGPPPGLPADARPFYIGYYIPGGGGGGGGHPEASGQGRGRGDPNRRMSGPSGPPVCFSQGPPPPVVMGSIQNMYPPHQHSPPTHVMHHPQPQHQQHPTVGQGQGQGQGQGHPSSPYHQQGPSGASSGLQLVVHNLPWSLTQHELKEHFSGFNADRAEVVLDNFGRSRGFGIVRFQDLKDAEAACNALNGSLLNDRVISVRPDRFA